MLNFSFDLPLGSQEQASFPNRSKSFPTVRLQPFPTVCAIPLCLCLCSILSSTAMGHFWRLEKLRRFLSCAAMTFCVIQAIKGVHRRCLWCWLLPLGAHCKLWRSPCKFALDMQQPPQVLEVCNQEPPVGDARVWPELWLTCKIHSWVRWLGIKSVRLRNTKLLQNAKATEPAADAIVAKE